MARLRRASPSPSVRDSSVFDGYGSVTPEPQSRPGRPGTTALSPSPSATSDKENQDVTPDRGFSRQNKGKGAMNPPPRPHVEQRGNKRRRLSEQQRPSARAASTPTLAGEDDEDEAAESDRATGNDAESHYTIPDQKWFNPEQDEDERRYVRLSMRENIRNFNDHRDELLSDKTSEKLVQHVKKANKLYGSVRQTADATIDSRFLVSASELAIKKAKADGDTSAGVDIDDFLSRCIRFMKAGGASQGESDGAQTQAAPRMTQTQRQSTRHAGSDDDGEDDGDGLPWHVFGAAACFPCNRRPPVPNFLLGPLSVQKRVRAATQHTQRRTQNAATQQVSRPQELRGEDLQTNDNTNLTILVQKIYKRLAKVQQEGQEAIEQALDADGDMSEEALNALCRRVHIRRAKEDSQPGVPMFEFIINPWHFGQSVENCFYVSFLIKEGKVAVLFDEDGLPILRHIAKPRSIEEQRAQHVARRQAIVSLDHRYWRQLIDAFSITEPLIPNREEEQQHVGHTGWYG